MLYAPPPQGAPGYHGLFQTYAMEKIPVATKKPRVRPIDKIVMSDEIKKKRQVTTTEMHNAIAESIRRSNEY